MRVQWVIDGEEVSGLGARGVVQRMMNRDKGYMKSIPEPNIYHYMDTLRWRVQTHRGEKIRTDIPEEFIEDLCELKVLRRVE